MIGHWRKGQERTGRADIICADQCSLTVKEIIQAKGLSSPIGMRRDESFFFSLISFVAIDSVPQYGFRALFAWVRDAVVCGP